MQNRITIIFNGQQQCNFRVHTIHMPDIDIIYVYIDRKLFNHIIIVCSMASCRIWMFNTWYVYYWGFSLVSLHSCVHSFSQYPAAFVSLHSSIFDTFFAHTFASAFPPLTRHVIVLMVPFCPAKPFSHQIQGPVMLRLAKFELQKPPQILLCGLLYILRVLLI